MFEEEVGYAISKKGHGGGFLNMDIDKLDTPSKISKFLYGADNYISTIYWR